jgi:hypothetical protein
VNGGDEGDGRKTDWGTIVQVAGFLFAVAAWANDFTDGSEAKAVELAERLTVIECEIGIKCSGPTGERHADR